MVIGYAIQAVTWGLVSLLGAGLLATELVGPMQILGKRTEFLGDTKPYGMAALAGITVMISADLYLVPHRALFGAGFGLILGFVAALVVVVIRSPGNPLS